MDKLYVIMPMYNEEDNTRKVMCEWHEIINALGDIIVVIE